MSSHHIVREKQEPALIIVSITHFTDELLGQLLEWSPTLLVLDDAYEAVLSLGIKVDAVVGEQLETMQENTRFIPSNSSKLHSAINWLINEGYPAVNIVTPSFDPELFTALVGQINIVCLTATQRIFAVNSGFSKWKPEGTTIEILTNTSSLNYTNLEEVAQGMLKTIHDGIITLRFPEPCIFIAEEI